MPRHRRRFAVLITALAAVAYVNTVPGLRAAQPSGDAHPVVETDPVFSDSDAADDSAIWRHPSDPALSLIIGTDKRAGAIEVYDLSGSRRQRITGARANGVDLRTGVPLDGGVVDLVAVGGDDVRFFRVDPATRQLVKVDIGEDGSRVSPNGLCLYRSVVSGRLYLFGISLRSEVDPLEIVPSGGHLDLVPARKVWDVGHDSEACVADDALGHLYINEADVALWKYGAEPDHGTSTADRRAVDRVGSGGHRRGAELTSLRRSSTGRTDGNWLGGGASCTPRCTQLRAATATMGCRGGWSPREPWKGWSEKLKIPPSAATIR